MTANKKASPQQAGFCVFGGEGRPGSDCPMVDQAMGSGLYRIPPVIESKGVPPGLLDPESRTRIVPLVIQCGSRPHSKVVSTYDPPFKWVISSPMFIYHIRVIWTIRSRIELDDHCFIMVLAFGFVGGLMLRGLPHCC